MMFAGHPHPAVAGELAVGWFGAEGASPDPRCVRQSSVPEHAYDIQCSAQIWRGTTAIVYT